VLEVVQGAGPVAKPFGKTNIMWKPNAQDCGGGGDDYDYGCWEPADDDFEFPEVSDEDPRHVEIQWCDWGEEMVPCTPGFGGAYYLPVCIFLTMFRSYAVLLVEMESRVRGFTCEMSALKQGMRGNDRGIWPKSSGTHYQKKGPIEVYAGLRSDPYIYEEVNPWAYDHGNQMNL